MITLNNIISIFQDFAENKHKQIKSFRFGSIATENSEEVKYTVLWAKLAEPGAELDFQTDTFLFDVLILDKPNIKNEYQSTIEILSDTKLIANDFISYINRVNWVTNYSTLMKINLPITMTNYINMNADKAAGWGFQIKLTVPQGTEYCSIPL